MKSLLYKSPIIRTRIGAIGEWEVSVGSDPPVPGHVCVLRKTEEAARKKIRKDAQNHGTKPLEQTLRFARYVIVFTTFPADQFSASQVLDWYRLRWQVELVFKRFKSLAQFGHLPKFDQESAKAWLYGKLLVALLTEKNRLSCANFFPLGLPHSRRVLGRTSSSP